LWYLESSREAKWIWSSTSWLCHTWF